MKHIRTLTFLLCILLTSLPTLAKPTKVLFLVSSARAMAGHPTGTWLEEFAVPYTRLSQAGFEIAIASPKGGECVFDPRSLSYRPHPTSMNRLRTTLPLERVHAQDFDALFIPGGHAPMVDLAKDPRVGRLINDFSGQKKPVASVCHGPAAFLSAKTQSGQPWVAGRHLTSFTDSEEDAGGLAKSVPFLLEAELKKQGALFESGPNFKAKTVSDGLLITGQNPSSSEGVAQALISLLKKH